ncbi:MAG TPA: hypothetical protein V6D47_09125, partial [Oscillatoriaceae cyanobacterium]
MKRSILSLGAAIALAGCMTANGTPGLLAAAGGTVHAHAVATSAIAGTLSVPQALLENHGGGIVSSNAASIVSNNSGGLISLTKYAVQTVDESAQGGVKLYLADASGAPL